MKEDKGNLMLYKSHNNQPMVEVNLYRNTVWLSQKQIAQLFDKTIPTINEHITNIYEEKELQEKATIRNFRIVQAEGGRRVQRFIDFYNLDMIISIGYRVRSIEGTKFRIWATKVLKKHLINKNKSKKIQ